MKIKQPDGSWKSEGPLNVKQPDGSWKTYYLDGTSGVPLKQKQSDGTWKNVAWTEVSAAGCGALRIFNNLSSFGPNDDSYTSAELGFSIGFPPTFSTSTVWLSNNGYVIFAPSTAGFINSPYTPRKDLSTITNGYPGAFVFHADVDTNNIPVGSKAKLVQFGQATVDGKLAWVANWIDVGYFREHYDKLNSFQLVVINLPKGFYMEFNYCTLKWDTGDFSGGSNGFMTGQTETAAMMGMYYGAETIYVNPYIHPGSYTGGLVDSNTSTGLIHGKGGPAYISKPKGRYIFQGGFIK